MIGQHGVALAGLAGVVMSWAPVQARPADWNALDWRAGLTSAARMKRRLQLVEVTPRRLSTAMARVGLGLIFGDAGRLSLASMMRPERDLGYDSGTMRRDMRAMAGFALKL